MTARLTAYLAALALPPEGPARGHMRTAQALIAASCEIPPGLIARCWAESCGGNVAQAREYLRGARPWPKLGCKRGKLVRAVEAWEARKKESGSGIDRHAASV